jgi:hypothetical protein
VVPIHSLGLPLDILLPTDADEILAHSVYNRHNKGRPYQRNCGTPNANDNQLPITMLTTLQLLNRTVVLDCLNP